MTLSTCSTNTYVKSINRVQQLRRHFSSKVTVSQHNIGRIVTEYSTQRFIDDHVPPFLLHCRHPLLHWWHHG